MTKGFVPLKDNIPISSMLTTTDATLIGLDSPLKNTIVADLDYQGQLLFINQNQGTHEYPDLTLHLNNETLTAISLRFKGNDRLYVQQRLKSSDNTWADLSGSDLINYDINVNFFAINSK